MEQPLVEVCYLVAWSSWLCWLTVAQSGLFYQPRSKCQAYRDHYHVASPRVLMFRLSTCQVVQALCVLVRIMELGLLPAGAAFSRIEAPVRQLRGLLGKWRVVPTVQLLFAASRVGSVIRFRDNVGGDGIGLCTPRRRAWCSCKQTLK
ncbi:hypothetical protein F5883DRAFT_227634 [Diaporthe sp. PMI_573]|nr:hypothetical protein F5883DRAFT_227634 [Diaporthaceae sp. PMI_573]